MKPHIPEWEGVVNASMGLHNIRISPPVSLFSWFYDELEEEYNDAIEFSKWILRCIETDLSQGVST